MLYVPIWSVKQLINLWLRRGRWRERKVSVRIKCFSSYLSPWGCLAYLRAEGSWVLCSGWLRLRNIYPAVGPRSLPPFLSPPPSSPHFATPPYLTFTSPSSLIIISPIPPSPPSTPYLTSLPFTSHPYLSPPPSTLSLPFHHLPPFHLTLSPSPSHLGPRATDLPVLFLIKALLENVPSAVPAQEP